MASPYINRNLFDGAITATTPSDLIDASYDFCYNLCFLTHSQIASDFRQVPDNQEVFMYPHNNVSVIVEVLQRVEESDRSRLPSRFHFNSLAHDNSAESSKIQEIQNIQNSRGDATPSVIVLYGLQQIRKFNHQEADIVKVLMGLYRVKEKNVDLVVTFNVPLRIDGGEMVSEVEERQSTKDFDQLVKSLKIVNFGLFA
ncbi:Ran guanine nucleotide release factor [Leucoagaricus sp. SymC.cos]|nr:Ran guanine nucleotide release factor [Leucoagaricus sp. SymC.cos]